MIHQPGRFGRFGGIGGWTVSFFDRGMARQPEVVGARGGSAVNVQKNVVPLVKFRMAIGKRHRTGIAMVDRRPVSQSERIGIQALKHQEKTVIQGQRIFIQKNERIRRA